MDQIPLGVIEIVLAFGAILAWATWEVRKNKKALEKAREKEGR